MGHGGSVFTTKAGLLAIRNIGKVWRANHPESKVYISADRAGALAVDVFGQALAMGMSKSRTLKDAQAIFFDLFEKHVDSLRHDLHHHFPCHLFEDVEIGFFSIGPVEFRTRLKWLELATSASEGKITWTEDVRRFWEFGTPIPDSAGPASLSARIVADGVGSCPWIASVFIRRQESSRSKERANIAARLAIDALGASLRRDVAARLRGPGDELRPTLVTIITQRQGYDFIPGTRLDLPRIGGAPGFARDLLKNIQPYLKAAGESIEVIIHSDSNSVRNKLKQRWCDALYWFGEARRDTADFTALVRYGIALDILAKGGKGRGIKALLAALFERALSAKFLSDGTSLAKAVDELYNTGRSQLAHGGRPALVQDLPFQPAVADLIASEALITYALCLNAYTGDDEYEDFFAALPGIVASLPRPKRQRKSRAKRAST